MIHKKAAHRPEQEFPGTVRLVLPKVIHAVPGIECNIYFDNVVLVINPANYVFDASCPIKRSLRGPGKGMVQTERWTFTPAQQDIGGHSIQIEVIDEANTVLARATSLIRVVPADTGAGTPISLLCIGDSFTHDLSGYTRHLLDICRQSGNPRLTLIGSHQPDAAQPENRHEGYGGWTAERFITQGVARSGDHTTRGSPFLYPTSDGTSGLDFPRYCRETNQGKAPDFATILLGGNDLFFCTDETIDPTIDAMFGSYDMLIRMLHDFSPETRIGLVSLFPSPREQNAFGLSYGCMKTRWQHKRNQHRLVERMTERYQGRESKRIWIVPADVNLDCVHGYPEVAAPWNSRTDIVGTRQNNAHPTSAGYRQIGDSLFCWLKAVLAATGRGQR